jgi:fibro-slime domain-containing protein
MRKLVLVTALCLVACGGSSGPPGDVCGDGQISGSEGCDDGNNMPGDGCSASCQEESGFKCLVKGAPCVKLLYCGDGIIKSPEVCDDGNSKGGDGCSGTCQLEPNFTCPTPGQACVSTSVCGDGLKTGSEQCDDGKGAGGSPVGGDGCSATCTVEDGWSCPDQGGKCGPTCGDGQIKGSEQCDLGSDNGKDKGCTATCAIQPGWVCGLNSNNVYGCHQTVCGDHVKEGSEQCDEGDVVPFDGCSPTCTIEPVCSGGNCTAVCGDGLVFPSIGGVPGEQCDDGNLVNGDGCSSTCMLESETASGFHCEIQNLPPPAQLVIPILYHDMRYNNTPNGTPDFQNFNPGKVLFGLVNPNLGTDGKPVWADNFGFLDANKTVRNTDLNAQALSGKDNFDCWYRDTCNGGSNTFATKVWKDQAAKPTTLTLNQTPPGSNVYRFADSTFFPLDGLGWNAQGSVLPAQLDDGVDGLAHNFSFTSELHYPFTYQAGANPRFDFRGDDDVWVFINGHLAVDIGGVHGTNPGDPPHSITLDAATAAQLGMTDKGMYTIDMFQAERFTKQSNYELTLSGFIHAVSVCTPKCGDGKVVGNEVCDDGALNGMPGHCNATCSGRIAKCGDGIITLPETCDNGVNDGTYGTCTTECKLAAFCGDNQKNGPEQCDNGAQNVGLDQYGPGKCTVTCTTAPYCGDGIVETAFGEQCEGGANCFDCKYAVIQ